MGYRILQKCPDLPSAVLRVKCEDDSELYNIFKKRRQATTTTLRKAASETINKGSNQQVSTNKNHPTTPPARRPAATVKPKPIKPTSTKKPTQNIRNYFKQQENNEKTETKEKQTQQITQTNNTITSPNNKQQQEAATMPKTTTNTKKTKPKQQPNNNSILKYLANQTTTSNQQNKQPPQQQQVDPAKMTLKIKGKLVTDLKSYLEEKRAEREGKLLEKRNPPKLKSGFPRPFEKPPLNSSSAKATPNNATQDKIERESDLLRSLPLTAPAQKPPQITPHRTK